MGKRSLTLWYICAPVAIALATWLRVLLDPALGTQIPYLSLLLAVLFIAARGGFGPGMVAVVLGAFACDVFLIPPRGAFKLESWNQAISLAAYIALGLGISVLGGAMRKARLRAQTSALSARYQTVLSEQTHDAILVWDWNGAITFWNHGAERLYGFPREEALTRVSHRLLGTERAGGLQHFLGALEKDGSWEGELEHFTRDGTKVFVESRMVVMREEQRAYVVEANRDITARKTAEAALLKAKEQLEANFRERTVELAQANASLGETQERYQLMVSGVRDYAVFMLDPRGNVASWNLGAERVKGYRADEIQGRHFSIFYTREDQDAGKPEQRLKAALADGNCLEEGWRVRKDGSQFWASVLITAMYDEQGQLRGFSKITRDLTQSRREEEALQESQARMGGLIDSAMDAIISINQDQCIVLFNAAAEQMFRCPASQAMGKSIEMFIPAKLRELHREHVRGFGATGVTSRSMRSLGALSGVRTDGEIFPIEASISQLDVAGKKQYTVILRDITERKNAEDALRKSEAQLQTIVESLDEGVVTADLTGRLLHFNRAALDVHGFTSMEECLRREPEFADTFELRNLDGTILPVDQWPVSHILRGEKLRDMEVRIRRHQGDWERIFSYGGRVIKDRGGEPFMAVITIADITERKRAAEEIRQLNAELEQRVVERTTQLEAANKELEAFSYSVSHDLRAPLRAVDGFSQTLLEDFGPQLPAEGQRYLNIIRDGAQRMGQLIDDLLMFSRLSRQPLKKQHVDTAKLVKDTLQELSAEQEGRKVDVQIGDLRPCEGDRALLKQVWVNLISNALKYTRRCDLALIEVGCLSERGTAVYFVRDNGTGFDMKYAHKLFGVFQRLHLAEEFEGTGVGLAIVHRVVTRHGGRIWADAQVDRGAVFYFTLESEAKA